MGGAKEEEHVEEVSDCIDSLLTASGVCPSLGEFKPIQVREGKIKYNETITTRANKYLVCLFSQVPTCTQYILHA